MITQPESAMKFAFQKMQLEAPSLYALIDTWAEMQLSVTEETALLTGYGYAQEIAQAFTTLVLDWEATIRLERNGLDLPVGTYELILQEGVLYACREQQSYRLEDRPVGVEVVSEVE